MAARRHGSEGPILLLRPRAQQATNGVGCAMLPPRASPIAHPATLRSVRNSRNRIRERGLGAIQEAPNPAALAFTRCRLIIPSSNTLRIRHGKHANTRVGGKYGPKGTITSTTTQFQRVSPDLRAKKYAELPAETG